MSIPMTSRPNHHLHHQSSKLSEVVDFNSLVWPPPELRPVSSPKPYIVHSANNTSYTVYPGQTMSQARRAAGIRRAGTPSSVTESDEEPQASTSRVSLTENRSPLRPATAQASNYSHLASGPVEPLIENRPPLRPATAQASNYSHLANGPVEPLIENRPPLRPATAQASNYSHLANGPVEPLIENRPPLRRATALAPNYSHPANGPVESKSKGRFGCKDYPAGYSPTPRPLSPPINQETPKLHAPRPSAVVTPDQLFSDVPHSRSASAAYPTRSSATIPPNSNMRTTSSKRSVQPSRSLNVKSNFSQSHSERHFPVDFFQPHVISPSEHNKDLHSPAAENHGRSASYTRVSGRSGLSPSGVIERGNFIDTAGTQTFSTLQSGTGSRLSDTSPLVIRSEPLLTPPGNRTILSSRPHSSSAIPSNHFSSPSALGRHTSRHTSRDQTEIPVSLKPTRRGYWNRRGDTLSAEGRVIPATASQAYPSDLAEYPQYALMNESGRVVLPEIEEDRVAVWRTVVQ